MTKIKPTDYTYAVGKIRAREAWLISRGRFLRMAEEESVDGVVKELGNTDHEGKIPLPLSEDELDRYIEKHKEEILQLISRLSQHPGLTNLLILRNDFHNLKLAFKIYFAKKQYHEIKGQLFLNPSIYSPEEVKLFVENRQFTKFSQPLYEGASKVFSHWDKEKTPAMIDALLDEVYFSYAKELLQSSEERFLERMFIIEIDLINIQAFVRFKKMAKEIEFLEAFLISGGELDKNIFIENFTLPWERFKQALQYKDYRKVTEEKNWGIEDTGWIPSLERRCEDFLTRYIQKAKYVSFGLEPLFGYWWAKNIEMKNLRNVLMGKLNHLSGEEIKSDLRETYN